MATVMVSLLLFSHKGAHIIAQWSQQHCLVRIHTNSALTCHCIHQLHKLKLMSGCGQRYMYYNTCLQNRMC